MPQSSSKGSNAKPENATGTATPAKVIVGMHFVESEHLLVGFI